MRSTRGRSQRMLEELLGPENFALARSRVDIARIDPADLVRLQALATVGAGATTHVGWLRSLISNIPVIGRLDENAVSRILARSNVDQVKGQLLEELAGIEGRRMEAQLRTTLGDGVEFIPGHRIADASGRQLTDGMLVRRVDGRLEVLAVFESKAGEASSRGLRTHSESLADLSPRNLAELRAVAIEDLRLEHADWSGLRSSEIAERHGAAVEARMRALHGSEAGQIRGDIERLAPNFGDDATSILIDGESIDAVLSPTSTRFMAAVPSDVSLGRLGADLAIEEVTLERMSMAVDSQTLQSTAEQLFAEAQVNGARLVSE